LYKHRNFSREELPRMMLQPPGLELYLNAHDTTHPDHKFL